MKKRKDVRTFSDILRQLKLHSDAPPDLSPELQRKHDVLVKRLLEVRKGETEEQKKERERRGQFWDWLADMEVHAIKILQDEGYITKDGRWVKGKKPSSLDNTPNLNSIAAWKAIIHSEETMPLHICAVRMMYNVRVCRECALEGKLEETAVNIAKLTYHFLATLRKRGSSKGGSHKPIARQAIKAAAAKLVQEGYEATDIAWEHLKDLWQNGTPYFAGFSHINHVPDLKRKEGYLREDDNDRTLTTYRTFDGYMREARKIFWTSQRK